MEEDELDNLNGPLVVTVGGEGAPPPPPPTPDGDWVIQGSTWLYIGGSLVPQGRVSVSLRDQVTGELVDATLSDVNGDYQFPSVKAGTYWVYAELVISEIKYTDLITDIGIPAPDQPDMTVDVTLILHYP
jgi:hypothetical protein